MMNPPEYFPEIEAKSLRRWRQLEGDPELAGPWHQLFKQVQSPRHVVSELLQNADDAGARNVDIQIDRGEFIFQHDGKDFSADEFASLCRFGYSNKRSLHTIGFRGIGFKSLFSLGSPVRLQSPTLNIRFDRDRFTLPKWDGPADGKTNTRISVAASQGSVLQELEANLNEWASSPLSLLFFSSIRNLCINGRSINKVLHGSGPCENSQQIEMEGSQFGDLIHIWSDVADFPAEAVDEIRQERNADDLNLPPCRVEIVLGNFREQKLFVVLPTGVRPHVPFSIHAPFLQDPARYGIKDPSTSPTNRWLLNRVGELAAKAMFQWLDNRQLDTAERAIAYRLLPENCFLGSDLDGSVTQSIRDGFLSTCRNLPILLAYDGELAFAPKGFAYPTELRKVWSKEQVNQIFGLDDYVMLSAEVDQKHSSRLSDWDFVEVISDRDAFGKLCAAKKVPRPSSWESLSHLWGFVENSRGITSSEKDRVPIVPIAESDTLLPGAKTVRLFSRRNELPDSEYEFLAANVDVVDPEWVQLIRSGAENPNCSNALTASARLLKELHLDSATPAERLLSIIYRKLSENGGIAADQLIRITHLFAALRAAVPAGFGYLNQNGEVVSKSAQLTLDADGSWQDVLPEEIYKQHIISARYNQPIACSRERWLKWARSPQSGLTSGFLFANRKRIIDTRDEFEAFLSQHGLPAPDNYQYKAGEFEIIDRVVISEITSFIDDNLESNPEGWVTLTNLLFADRVAQDHGLFYADIKEVANRGQHRKKAKTQPLPCQWIRQLAARRCLLDDYSMPRVPAELLVRSVDTDPVQGIERFVNVEIDTETNRDLLLLLGASDKASGVESITDRVRALATVPQPPIHELAKWYEALDKAATRATPDELERLRRVFADERLIFSEDEQWNLSSEVFALSDQDVMPGATLVHSSVAQLPLWKRLGVADRPSLERIVQWLSDLKQGQTLEPQQAKRVRAALQSFPSQIVQQCNAWLTLDNRWQSIATLRYRLAAGTRVNVSSLFTAAKQHTADLRFLSDQSAVAVAFGGTQDLSQQLQSTVSDVEKVGAQTNAPDWLAELAKNLQRLVIEDDAEKQSHIREVAGRLRTVSVQSIRHLKVTPYLQGTPVGQSDTPKVCWHDDVLYVQTGATCDTIEELISALKGPFEDSQVSNAIRLCVERTPNFIRDYFQAHFELGPEPIPIPQSSSKTSFPSKQGSVVKEPSPDEESGSLIPPPAARFPSANSVSSTGDLQPGVEFNEWATEFSDAQDDSAEPKAPPSWFPSNSVESSGQSPCDTPSLASNEPFQTNQGDAISPAQNPDSVLADQPSLDAPTPAHTAAGNESASAELESHDAAERAHDDTQQVSGDWRSSLTDANYSDVSPDPQSDDTASAENQEKAEKLSLIEQFAQANGFLSEPDGKSYGRQDGYRISRSSDIFHYDIVDPEGTCIQQVWLSSQSLRTNVELPTEVWEMLRSSPERSALVTRDARDDLKTYSGKQLLTWLNADAIKLFPAKYRLVMTRTLHPGNEHSDSQ